MSIDLIPVTKLIKKDGIVAIEFVCNKPVFASYRIDLLDHNRKLTRNIGNGYNSDNDPDRFELVETPAKLDGCHIAFTAAVAPFTKEPTSYSVVVILSQEKSGTVSGGVLQDAGQVSEPKYVVGITRLEAV